MDTLSGALVFGFSAGVVTRAIITALIVGTILTCINQVMNIPRWARIALTYCVPYIVFTLGAVLSHLNK
jgi:fructose-specific phosphotransferase system IIC component